MTNKEIETKKQLLEKAKRNVKNYFVGIDDAIDDIFSKLEIWWVYPSFLTRPTVICLWGITGVGKTDLVRKIVKELGLSDRFVDIQMDNYNINGGDVYKSPSILGRLFNSGISTNTTGVLLLDEIQRYNTIDKLTGSDTRRKPMYDDVWKLLSDGTLTDDSDSLTILNDILHRQTNILNSYMSNPINTNFSGNILTRNTLSRMDIRSLAQYLKLTDEDIANIWEYKLAVRGYYVYQYDKFIVEKSRNKEQELLRSLNIIELISLLEYKIDELYSSDTPKDGDNVYSKLLIFISGNLDDVFEGSKDIKNIDADTFYEQVSTITLDDVKQGLLKLFRPEHVSRFGNNHVIYKSLRKKDFEELITRELNRVSTECESKYGIKVDLQCDNLKKRIYKDGVFPTQGVRPLFTTISSVVGEILPKLLVEATTKDLTEITYRED